jgi:hypothetical protein
MTTKGAMRHRLSDLDRDPEANNRVLVWALSLLVEIILLSVLWDRRAYQMFRAYLLIDVVASVILFILAANDSGSYDVAWRIVQLGMIIPRTAVAMEVYQSMSATRRYWRFSDVSAIPLAGCAALIFRLAQDAPLRWPWSNLEQVFIAVGTFNAFLAMVILTILTARHRRPLIHTEDFWHGCLFVAYAAITSVGYFGAARFAGASQLLMWAALTFYCLRLFLSFAAAPVDPIKRHVINTWESEDRPCS